jgi:hypothetical protein
MTTYNNQRDEQIPAELQGVSVDLDRLAQADGVTPAGMQVRIAAAAMTAARQGEPAVLAQVHSAAPRALARHSRGRQWAMAAMVLIGCGVGFGVLSRLAEPTPTIVDRSAVAQDIAQDMENWLTLTDSSDETFTSAVKQLTTDTSRVSESVTSPSTISLDGDSL